MNEQPPLPKRSAAAALGRCGLRTAVLVARHQIRQPSDHVGRGLHFADGSSTAVYRETVIAGADATRPAVLVVCFRLRRLHRERLHALFRLESELNTVLFAGFPGLVSKLWCRHDRSGLYRGLYEWDDPALAEAYVRALWWVLALVSERGSIHYAVLPGLRRDELLADPDLGHAFAPDEDSAWWRLVRAEERARA
jgi:hypothetical protein